MKSTLIVGLGNPLAGDDGVGWHLAARLRNDSRLGDDVDIVQGGTDLLAIQDQLAGRGRLILLDALLDDGPIGRVLVLSDLADLEDRAGSAHHVAPALAIRLLRAGCPRLESTPTTFLCITIRESRVQPGLSPELASALGSLADEVLEDVTGLTPAP